MRIAIRLGGVNFELREKALRVEMQISTCGFRFDAAIPRNHSHPDRREGSRVDLIVAEFLEKDVNATVGFSDVQEKVKNLKLYDGYGNNSVPA